MVIFLPELYTTWLDQSGHTSAYFARATLVEQQQNVHYFLQTGDLELLDAFQGKEQAHLIEVKALFAITKIFLITAMAVTLIYFIAGLYKKNTISFRISLVLVFIINTVFSGILMVIGFFGFSNFFIGLHQIVFSNDWWLLPPEYLLINIYPEIFFQSFFIAWLILAVICSIVLLIFSSFFKLNKK